VGVGGDFYQKKRRSNLAVQANQIAVFAMEAKALLLLLFVLLF